MMRSGLGTATPPVASALAVFLLVGLAFSVRAQPSATLTLESPNPQFGGEFGYSVAASGYGVIVGAPGETVRSDAFAGRAYVFEVPSGSPSNSTSSPTAGRLSWAVLASAAALAIAAVAGGLVLRGTRPRARPPS